MHGFACHAHLIELFKIATIRWTDGVYHRVGCTISMSGDELDTDETRVEREREGEEGEEVEKPRASNIDAWSTCVCSHPCSPMHACWCRSCMHLHDGTSTSKPCTQQHTRTCIPTAHDPAQCAVHAAHNSNAGIQLLEHMTEHACTLTASGSSFK